MICWFVHVIQSKVDEMVQQGEKHDGNHAVNLGHGIEPDTPKSQAAFLAKNTQGFRTTTQ